MAEEYDGIHRECGEKINIIKPPVNEMRVKILYLISIFLISYKNINIKTKHASDEPLLWDIKYGRKAKEENIVNTKDTFLLKPDLIAIWLATNNDKNMSEAFMKSNLSENCLKKSIIKFG